MVVCLQIHALLCFKFLYILDDGLLIDSSLFLFILSRDEVTTL